MESYGEIFTFIRDNQYPDGFDNMIQCDLCEQWLHMKCEKLKGRRVALQGLQATGVQARESYCLGFSASFANVSRLVFVRFIVFCDLQNRRFL